MANGRNTKDDTSGFCSFASPFDVDDGLASRYPAQVVGSAKMHGEIWGPAEDFAAHDAHLTRPIRVLESFCGDWSGGARDATPDLPMSLAFFPASGR